LRAGYTNHVGYGLYGELARLAEQEALTLGSPGLAYAHTVWNQKLDVFENIVGLHYRLTGSTKTGMLGQIRTQLLDIIADLTADTRLAELPGKEQVDAAANERIGHARDIYNTTIQEASGPTAIGSRANAMTEGLSVEHALRLLGEVRRAAGDVEVGQLEELEAAIAELRAALESDSPDTGDVVKKVGKLRAVADKLGVVAVSAATSSATSALTELAVNGAFNSGSGSDDHRVAPPPREALISCWTLPCGGLEISRGLGWRRVRSLH